MDYSKEYLEKVILESKSISDVIRNYGLKMYYGNRKTIKKYIDLYNLDISHFISNNKYNNNKNINNFIKQDLNSILIENSTYTSTNHLKNRLYKEGLKERKCELCEQGEEWNGKHMSLILDHINGINNDNRLENLRIVCPNCNATLDTHCIGNKKIKNKHIIYGNNKTDNEIIKSINNRKIERPSYKQLLDEIKEFGYCGTGRKYGVSDTAIRKWVKNYEKNN